MRLLRLWATRWHHRLDETCEWRSRWLSLLVPRQSVNHIQQLPQSCTSSYPPISVACKCQIVCMLCIASRMCQHSTWTALKLYSLLLISNHVTYCCSEILLSMSTLKPYYLQLNRNAIYGYSEALLGMAIPTFCYLWLLLVWSPGIYSKLF